MPSSGCSTNGGASSSGIAHELVNGSLRADIDARRRLVEHEDIRLGAEPFGENNLLLITTAQ